MLIRLSGLDVTLTRSTLDRLISQNEDWVQGFEDICAATDFDPEKVAGKGVRGCKRIICSTLH